MEAIDDYANENIVRSLAYTVIDQRQQGHYLKLLPIASPLLRQRVQFLGQDEQQDTEAWDRLIQWQQDNCPEMIRAFSDSDRLYQSPVYYQRLDVDTLHAMIEFAEKDKRHYVVILALEEGSGDISDLKYYNTKELSDEAWRQVFENWSRTIEDAERIFLTKVTRHKPVLLAEKDSQKEAPEDYWGQWSSEEDDNNDDSSEKKKKKKEAKVFNIDEEEEASESDEEYFTRWSKDPGTLTPGPEVKEDTTRRYQELAEEYDHSYNPLFTVPSVPNLMDTHTAALSELTLMLQNTIPQQNPRPLTQINPLPKAVSRLRSLPGAYPESPSPPPIEVTKTQEIGRGLWMKSLSALLSAARLMGYDRQAILEMVHEVMDRE